MAATGTFTEALHPRIRKGLPGAGQFIDVLGALEGFKAHYDGAKGIWNVPNERRPEFDAILKKLGWQARIVPEGMRAAKPEDHDRFKWPPAWTSVLVHDHPLSTESGLMVTGVDAKGKLQYVYDPETVALRAAEKFARVNVLEAQLPALDDALSKDALSNDDAGALMLIRKLGMRVGSTADTMAKVQAYGASTLQARHVKVTGDKVKFDFIGKKGVHIRLAHTDPELAQMLSARLLGKKGTDSLFPGTSDEKVRVYMDGIVPGSTPKDLRTRHANFVARHEIAKLPVPDTLAEYKRQRNQVGDAVSQKLGNNRTEALKSYINPTVFAPWEGANNQTAVSHIDAPTMRPVPTTDETDRLHTGSLPQRSELYFNVDERGLKNTYGPDTVVREVPIGHITPIRARPEGIANAKPLMADAALGEGAKRDPIILVARENGYSVHDGNSTFAIASEENWTHLPALIARDDQHAAVLEATAKEAKRKAKEKRDRNFAPPEIDPLHAAAVHNSMVAAERDGDADPATQNFATFDEQLAASAAVLPEFTELVNAAAHALGGSNVPHATAVNNARTGKRGPMGLVAPLKGMERAREKIETKYDGDHNRLQDVVRGTIIVDDLAAMPAAIAAIRREAEARGWALRKFENRYEIPPPDHHVGPTNQGYRDAGYGLVSPSGVVTELQVNTSPMYAVKERDGHALYERYRAMVADIKRRGTPATDHELALMATLEQEQKDLYGRAWRQSYGW